MVRDILLAIMISGMGGQDFNIRGVGSTTSLRSNAPVQPAPQEDDDAAFRFLESWSSSPDTSGQLSLDKMLQLQSTSGSEVPQKVITEPKPQITSDDEAAAQIEFLIKSNRKTFQAHGALGSAGISDGWNLAH
ncbi:hypothetical protein JST97_17595 [bacterium]|nr:hypothetical protein [bacterium]